MMPVPFGQHIQIHLNTQMERLPHLRYHFYTKSTNEVGHCGLSVASRCQVFFFAGNFAGWARDFTLSPCQLAMSFVEFFHVITWPFERIFWLFFCYSILSMIDFDGVFLMQKVICSCFASCFFCLSFFSPFIAPEKNREHHLYKLT